MVRQRPGWTLAASMVEPAAVSRCRASWTEQYMAREEEWGRRVGRKWEGHSIVASKPRYITTCHRSLSSSMSMRSKCFFRIYKVCKYHQET